MGCDCHLGVVRLVGNLYIARHANSVLCGRSHVNILAVCHFRSVDDGGECVDGGE